MVILKSHMSSHQFQHRQFAYIVCKDAFPAVKMAQSLANSRYYP